MSETKLDEFSLKSKMSFREAAIYVLEISEFNKLLCSSVLFDHKHRKVVMEVSEKVSGRIQHRFEYPMDAEPE